MSARSIRLLTVLCLLMAWRTPAATLYVDLNSPARSAPYANWTTAATNIQDAVDASSPGDLVLVTNGTYATGGRALTGYLLTNRVILPKPIILQSVNGPSVTAIQGYQVPGITNGDSAVRCVYLTNGASLSGFTLTSGATRNAGDQVYEQSGGGVLCASTNAAISNCVIVANSSQNAGGGAYLGTLVNCTLATNSSGFGGGGAEYSTLNNCAVVGNFAPDGGGVFYCLLNNCILTSNIGNNGAAAGAGTLNNCFIAYNTNLMGHGAVQAAILNNCTVVRNSGGSNYAGLGGVLGGTANNCIVYFNTGSSSTPNYSSATFNYSCTTPPPGGTGNISADPQITDFHISAFSPCRGAGSSLYTTGTDLDGEAWLNPPSIGCDEYYGRGPLIASIVSDRPSVTPGYAANLTALVIGSLSSNKIDFGDGTSISNTVATSHIWSTPGDYQVVLTAYNLDNPAGVTATVTVHVFTPIKYVSLNSANPLAPYSSWATAATNIQDAVDASSPGDLILVTNGVYATGGSVISGGLLTNRVLVNKAVTLQSVNGSAATVIQGYQAPDTILGDSAVRCVYLTNGSSLVGFTLTYGATRTFGYLPSDTTGGGVWCSSGNVVISNCVLTINTSIYGGGDYGGTLTGCLLSNNVAFSDHGPAAGAGVYGGSLSNCTLIGNAVAPSQLGYSSSGGGVSTSVLYNCILMSNTGPTSGGGAYSSTLNNCFLNVNSSQSGGGAFGCMLNDCTVVHNVGTTGAGGTLNCTNYNCIVYFNTTFQSTSNYSGSLFINSCTFPAAVGVGNISADPLLTDFHISGFSPCRGAGSAVYTTGTDLDGEAWLNPPSMGCDEFFGHGSLTVAIQADTMTLAPGFSANFTAQIAGSMASNKLDFGDGAILTNVFSATHAWSAPGDYPVVLTAYNLDNPVGVSATLTIHVLAHPFQYVSLTSTNPSSPYNSWATAATNIQDAVDVGFPGGTILVSNGVYQTGGRTFSTNLVKNRVVVTKPVTLQSVNGPSVTFIQGNTSHSSLSVRCVYLTNGATLTGFTLTQGEAYFSAGPPTVRINDQLGGGVFCASSNAVVSNCVITGNQAYFAGGGVYSGSVYQCDISNNYSVFGGGCDSAVLFNCLLVSNTCLFSGGGACSNLLYNCLLTGNTAITAGGGGSFGDTLQNCIIWSNTAPTNPNYASTLSYCCTTPLPTNGIGNITNDPLFINPAVGNFHLQSGSPCINAGNNAAVTTASDLDGHPRILGSTVDIGPYEFEPVYVSLNSLNPVAPYNSWATAATNIQDAVDAASPFDFVIVTNGVYATGGQVIPPYSLTNRVVITNRVTVQSVNGPAVTFFQGNQLAGSIDGPGAIRCAYLGNGASLIGITLSNGATLSSSGKFPQKDLDGAGVWCDTTNETMINCVVCGNVAESLAGGVANGNLQGCLISNNIAGQGGGVCLAVSMGGIIPFPRLSNCTLVGNSAIQGGGAYAALLVNCLVVGNSATSTGGGIWDGFLENCTVSLNLASSNGGIGGDLLPVGPPSTIAVNSIICSNIASTNPNYSTNGSTVLTNCCTTPLPPSGTGNITNDPLFVDPLNGNFRLQSNSPCINAGNNLYVPTSLDLDGNPRIAGGTVDIGAYEFQNPTSQLSYAWLQQYNLPTDGSADFADTDADGLNNYQEWRAGTDPTNPNSRLLLLPPIITGTNHTITWQSVTNHSYYLQRSPGLTPASFQPLATNIVGQPGTTTYTDTNAPAPGPWFYRVGVQ